MNTDNGKTIEVSSQEAIGDSPIQGFATKDGEVTSRGGKPVEAPARQAAQPAVKAKAPAEGDDQAQGQAGDDSQRHKSAQARIDRAVGRQREAERERDALRSRLDAIEARLNGNGHAQQPQQQQRQAPTDGAPDVTKYEYGELDARYIRDLARYEARQEFQAQQENVKRQDTSAAQERANAEWRAKADEFRDSGIDKYDDFEELVLDNSLPLTQTLAELFFDSKHGVDIAYEYAQDPQEAKRISAMSPARQAAWFGRKEAEYSSESPDADDDAQAHEQAPRSRKTTQAPPPPKSRTRGSGGQQEASGATTDFAQFERMASKRQ